MKLREQCYDKLHSYPGSDEIAISYIDIGNCLGCAYQSWKLIIINPFHLLAFPEFVVKYIVPHEYCHIMMDDHEGHSEDFFNYFELVTGKKHPPINNAPLKAQCKYHLEVTRNAI